MLFELSLVWSGLSVCCCLILYRASVSSSQRRSRGAAAGMRAGADARGAALPVVGRCRGPGARRTGAAWLCRALRPLLRRLFPACAADDEGFSSLCGNLAANLLGLGNAATPLGVRAVQRMQAAAPARPMRSATRCVCCVVMNTASMQLMPVDGGRRARRARRGARRSTSSRRCGWRRPAPSRRGSWRRGGCSDAGKPDGAAPARCCC